ncbi:hypothetical protein ACCT00_36405, partial [Rhizobium ruizarguesonis]
MDLKSRSRKNRFSELQEIGAILDFATIPRFVVRLALDLSRIFIKLLSIENVCFVILNSAGEE